MCGKFNYCEYYSILKLSYSICETQRYSIRNEYNTYENYKYRQITYNINIQYKHTILAHLYLSAKTFAFYKCQCERSSVTIGVNMFYLFKLINTIDNDNTLTMYIEEQ